MFAQAGLGFLTDSVDSYDAFVVLLFQTTRQPGLFSGSRVKHLEPLPTLRNNSVVAPLTYMSAGFMLL